MNRNLCRIGLAALALCLLPAAVSAETKVLRYEGSRAHAFFETLDPGGCIRTWTDVYVFGSETRALPSPQETIYWLIVFIGRDDLCQSVPLNLVYGSALLSEGDYSFSGSHSAHVSRSLEGSDFVAGTTVPLTVDVTWEGRGALDQARDRNRFISPEFKWIFHSWGFMRDAVATGSVVMGMEMLTPAPAAQADLSSNEQGNLYISR